MVLDNNKQAKRIAPRRRWRLKFSLLRSVVDGAVDIHRLSAN